MKPVQLTLHPSSALAGAFLLALCLITLGAFTPQGSSSDRDVSAIEITNQPNPNDYFSISSGTPYVVPAGKTFVLTSAGCTANGGDAWFLFNGVQQLFIYSSDSTGTGTSVKELAPGITAPANTTIEVVTTQNPGILHGYLIDA